MHFKSTLYIEVKRQLKIEKFAINVVTKKFTKKARFCLKLEQDLYKAAHRQSWWQLAKNVCRFGACKAEHRFFLGEQAAALVTI
jgi:hypothetical protein